MKPLENYSEIEENNCRNTRNIHVVIGNIFSS